MSGSVFIGLTVLISQLPEPVLVSTTTVPLERAVAHLGALTDLPVGTGRPLSLAELIESIQRHHPRLDVADARIGAGRAERRAAAGAYDPRLSADMEAQPIGGYETFTGALGLSQLTPLWGLRVEGEYRASAGELPEYKLYEETLAGGELSLGLRLPVLRDGPIDAARARLQRADALVQMLEAERTNAGLDLIREASGHYFAWVVASKQYEVARSWYQLAERRDEQLRRMVQEGALPEVERLDNLRSMLSRRDAVLEIQRRMERAAISLSFYLRDARGEPVVPTAGRAPKTWDALPTPNPGIDADIRVAREHRPELRVLTALQSQLEVDLQLSQNQVLPKLELSLDLSKDLGLPSGPRGDKLEPFSVMGGAKLELPLFLREGLGQRDRAEARIREQLAQVRLIEDRIIQELRDAHSAVAFARLRLDALELASRIAQSVARAEGRRFELGSSSIINVNLREQAAVSAQVALIEAEAELARSLLAYSIAIYHPRVFTRGSS